MPDMKPPKLLDIGPLGNCLAVPGWIWTFSRKLFSPSTARLLRFANDEGNPRFVK